MWTRWAIFLWPSLFGLIPDSRWNLGRLSKPDPDICLPTNVGIKGERLRSQTYSLASTAPLNFEITWCLLPEPETLQRKPCHLALVSYYWLSWGIVWATKRAHTGLNEFFVSDHSSHTPAGFTRELGSKYDQHQGKLHVKYL